jgi:hypothetical protein
MVMTSLFIFERRDFTLIFQNLGRSDDNSSFSLREKVRMREDYSPLLVPVPASLIILQTTSV